jgi:putative transposase
MKAERKNYPIYLMCYCLEVSKSGFYKWLKNGGKNEGEERHTIESNILKIHKESRLTYGRRRIHAMCVRLGVRCGKMKVGRLMKRLGIRGVGKPKFKTTTLLNRLAAPSPNLVVQDFKTTQINTIWFSDITYVATEEGWLYLATVIDACSRRIIGWSMDQVMKAELVANAVTMALKARQLPQGVIFHSDRGSQYTSHLMKALLKDNGLHQSMSSSGNCYDNSMAESFFATLKKELIYRGKFTTRNHARREIFEYIEGFYNRQRIHSALAYQTPVEFEEKNNM